MTMPAIDLKDQIAVVTGGGRGIGRSMALGFAAAGAKVAILSRTERELAETAALVARQGNHAWPFPADVADAADVRQTFARIEQELGPVDVLVNNAGVLGPIAPFWETDPEAWWKVLDVNLRGPMLCAHSVLPGMIGRRRGRIINVATGAAVVPFTYFSAYVASKTALLRFTECLAAEAKPHDVRIFAMEPGTVRTAMSEYSVNSPEGKKWIPWFKRIFDEGLTSPPERAAQRAVYLASGQADSLAGRFLPLAEDLDLLQENLAEVERDKLYSLRINRFRPAQPSAALAAIRDAGEKAAGITLQVRRAFAAPRGRLFDAWTDTDAVRRWFLHDVPGDWLEPPRFDARPGGRFDLKLQADGRVFHLYGGFGEVLAGQKLVMEWCWGRDFPVLSGPGKTQVTVEFLQGRETTELLLTQELLPSMAARDAFERGWNRCLDGIAQFMSTEKA